MNFPIFKNLRQSWEIKTISDLCKKVVVGHVGPSSQYRDPKGIPFLMGKNVSANGLVLTDLERVSPEFHEREKKSQLSPGDILVVRIGKSGTAALVTTEICPANCAGLIVIKTPLLVYPKYLIYYLNSPEGQRRSAKQTKGTTRSTLNTKSIQKTLVPLPPPKIQKKIVAILEKAERLRQQRKKTDKWTGEFLRSVFLDMFYKKNHDYHKWKICSIQELSSQKKGSIRSGPFGSNLKHSEFVKKGVSVLGIDNVVNNNFQWVVRRYITLDKYNDLKRYTVYPNDVLITIMGTIGKSCIVPKEIPCSISTKHLGVITCDQSICNPQFLSSSIIYHPDIINQINKENRGAIMAGLNLRIIKSLKLRIPPLLLQNKFAIIFTKIDKMKIQQVASKKGIENLFNSFMEKAFKGELVN